MCLSLKYFFLQQRLVLINRETKLSLHVKYVFLFFYLLNPCYRKCNIMTLEITVTNPSTTYTVLLRGFENKIVKKSNLG